MQEEIAKVIEATFAQQWALLSPTPPPIKYQNVAFNQPASGEWISENIMAGSAGQASLGVQKVERQIGIVLFQIFTPKNTGDRRARAIADMIGDIMRNRQWALMADGSITQQVNGIVITMLPAGALSTEAGDILGTENGGMIGTEAAASVPVLTVLFRAPEPFPVTQKADFYQLNLRVAYQADALFN